MEAIAPLSPLRFHYDSEEFSLPIRLGMANSSGTGPDRQLLSATSGSSRNYKNVFIPTNFDVKNSVRERFGEFHAALFDKTLERTRAAIITSTRGPRDRA